MHFFILFKCRCSKNIVVRNYFREPNFDFDIAKLRLGFSLSRLQFTLFGCNIFKKNGFVKRTFAIRVRCFLVDKWHMPLARGSRIGRVVYSVRSRAYTRRAGRRTNSATEASTVFLAREMLINRVLDRT